MEGFTGLIFDGIAAARDIISGRGEHGDLTVKQKSFIYGTSHKSVNVSINNL